MTRINIINHLISKINAKSYLEIGVREPSGNFNHIDCPNKIAVDPFPLESGILPLTSDEYFTQNTDTFDVIFIDGLHHADQVEKDIINSLKVLNKNGYIICHDINPTTELMQIVPIQTNSEWTGDCWKAWVKIKTNNPNLNMEVVDTDFGVGIISVGSQKLLELDIKNLTYDEFSFNKKEWLNLISINEFSEKYKF
jgi:SAM-dependent methyltransferase